MNILLRTSLPFALAGVALAQFPGLTLPPSGNNQKASVTQYVGPVQVAIDYSSPNVHGTNGKDRRGEIWGKLVPYGLTNLGFGNGKPGPWRAGANDATVFQVTDDVLVNGQPLKAGTYSLSAIPGKDDWTIILNNDYGQWGAFAYDAKKDALRVKAKPRQVPESQESLLYSFDTVTANTATVNLRWEKVSVPFTVEVKDVKATWRARTDALIAANPTNEVFPLQAANTFAADKNWDLALTYVDQSIKVKPTFRNLSAKANILRNAGRKEEALAAADQAIAKGKADSVDTTAFEKRVAGWKSGT